MTRLVLDSNVWLDWLHFNDPRVNPLKTAMQNNEIEIVIDPPCLDELVKVLGYDRFGLEMAAQKSMLGEVDRVSTLLTGLDYVSADQLPWCADPDDVKFLALAQASGAGWLVTKDNALLARPKPRVSRSVVTRFRVGTPEQWSQSESATGH